MLVPTVHVRFEYAPPPPPDPPFGVAPPPPAPPPPQHSTTTSPVAAAGSCQVVEVAAVYSCVAKCYPFRSLVTMSPVKLDSGGEMPRPLAASTPAAKLSSTWDWLSATS